MDMTSIRLKYVTRDRSGGITRYYVRITGRPRVRLPGLPGSSDFMRAYERALKEAGMATGPPAPAAQFGTLASAIHAYYASAAFKLLSRERQAKARKRLAIIAKDAGDRRMQAITYADLVKSRDNRADKPGMADEFVKLIRAVFRHALEIGMIRNNPAADLKQLRVKSAGFHTATAGEIAAYVRAHPPGTRAHLALCLQVFTGARPCDAILLGRQHVRGDRLVFQPSKTRRSSGVTVDVRIAEPLRAAIQTIGGRMTFLETESGKPFASAKAYANRVKKWWIAAGVPHASVYSFRKGGATLAGDEGMSDLALMALFGWTTQAQAATYTRNANRARLADSAVSALERGISGTGIVTTVAPIVTSKEKHK